MKIVLKNKNTNFQELGAEPYGTFFRLADTSTLESAIHEGRVYMITESLNNGISFCSIGGENELVSRHGPLIGHVLKCKIKTYNNAKFFKFRKLEEFETGSIVRPVLGKELGEPLIIVKVQTDSINMRTLVSLEDGEIFKFSKEVIVVEHEAKLVIKGDMK